MQSLSAFLLLESFLVSKKEKLLKVLLKPVLSCLDYQILFIRLVAH